MINIKCKKCGNTKEYMILQKVRGYTSIHLDLKNNKKILGYSYAGVEEYGDIKIECIKCRNSWSVREKTYSRWMSEEEW